MSNDFDWSQANVERLRNLWATGASTAEIGRIMGCSKNAVVGKAGRLDLPTRPSPIIRDGRPRAPQPVARVVRQQAAALPPLTSVPAGTIERVEGRAKQEAQLARHGIAARPVQIEAAPRVEFKPIASRPCCWPMWGAGRPTHEYCGATARPGKPYCPEHHARAFTRLQSEAGDMAPWVRRDQGLRVAGDVGA